MFWGVLALGYSYRPFMKHLLLILALSAGSANAQVATYIAFGHETGALVEREPGVRRSLRPQFALLELGDWRPPPPALPVAPTLPEPSHVSSTVFDDQASASNGPCEGHPAPPPLRSVSVATERRRFVFWPLVRDLECRYALPVGLLDALLIQESRYQKDAVSRAGARGLGQLMPETARALGVVNVHDPVANLDGAARYLAQQLTTFGAPHLALAAYNAGPRRVARVGGIPNIHETREYVRAVLGYWSEARGGEGAARRMAQVLGFLP